MNWDQVCTAWDAGDSADGAADAEKTAAVEIARLKDINAALLEIVQRLALPLADVEAVRLREAVEVMRELPADAGYVHVRPK